MANIRINDTAKPKFDKLQARLTLQRGRRISAGEVMDWLIDLGERELKRRQSMYVYISDKFGSESGIYNSIEQFQDMVEQVFGIRPALYEGIRFEGDEQYTVVIDDQNEIILTTKWEDVERITGRAGEGGE